MAAGIASGFVRKLYRILDQENEAIVGWDATGLSFSIHDSQQLNDVVLPRYFRGRMSAFRQQLLDHGFEQIECEDDEARECYAHPHFLRGCPDRLSFIVRNPKPKLKPGQTAVPQQRTPSPPQPLPAQQTSYQHVNGHSFQPPQQQPMQPSLGIHIAPSVKGPGRAPLTVTLTAGKRASPMHATTQGDLGQKRLRGLNAFNDGVSHAQPQSQPPPQLLSQRPKGQVPTPAPPSNLSRNPLFSNEPSSDLGLDVARVFSLSRISDSGLLPNSTDLPEPISYLTRLLHGTSTNSAVPASSSSVASSTATSSQEPPVFSEDLMKSALYFLVSTSTTGVGQDQDANSWAARMERASTSGFLSSLLVSSATGKDGALSSSSVWGSNTANPLFSRSTEQEEEEDSIWNLLLASSIDRVKTAIQDVASPQERLRLILEERERLEEQRKRIYGLDGESKATPPGPASGPHKPTDTQSAKPLKSAMKKPATANPLFSGAKAAPIKSLLFTASAGSRTTTPTNTSSNKATTRNPLFSNDDDDDGDEGNGEAHGSQNPLFAKKTTKATANPLFSKESVTSASSTATTSAKTSSMTTTASHPPVNPSAAEDGLWRLLMTSSVDWLRKGAAEFEV